MNRKIGLRILLSGIVVSLLFLTGMTSVQAQPKTIILATTTSTQDSGLLDVLLPIFEKKTGYFVKTIAVGSGQAMAMGQKGEADVLSGSFACRGKEICGRGLWDQSKAYYA